MRRAWTAALLVAAASALTACTTSHVDNPTVLTPPSISPTSTAGVAGPPAAPCDALTTADVRTAFGGTVSTGTVATGTAPGTSAACSWKVTGSNVKADGTVSLLYPSAQSSQAFHSAEAALPGAEKVVELGDAAYYDPATAALTVLAGDREFVVRGAFGGGADQAALEVDLIALARVVDARF